MMFSQSNWIPFPTWAKRRDDSWTYVGWIKNPPAYDLSFGDLVIGVCQSDHGEKREVDVYPQGATCYYQEVKS